MPSWGPDLVNKLISISISISIPYTILKADYQVEIFLLSYLALGNVQHQPLISSIQIE
jgi:hypothetical protein